MATRPVKVGGQVTYTGEVAVGQTAILASEVDGDLNEIYSNINNTNVAASAGIAYSKLALTGSIVDADIATAAAIAGTKLGPLATNASVRMFAAAASVGSALVTGTAETLYMQSGAFTTAGGKVLMIGTCPLDLVDPASNVITLRFRRGTNPSYLSNAVIATWAYDLSGSGNTAEALPTPMHIDTPGTGTFYFSYSFQSAPTATAKTRAEPGTFFFLELA